MTVDEIPTFVTKINLKLFTCSLTALQLIVCNFEAGIFQNIAENVRADWHSENAIFTQLNNMRTEKQKKQCDVKSINVLVCYH